MNKKIIIFESVLDSINKTLSTDIKMAEVAKKAGIGKSTIYEYFKCKEELLSETILYLLDKQLINLESIIKEEKSFKENYFNLIKAVTKIINENIYFIKYVLVKDNFCNFNDELKKLLTKRLKESTDFFRKLLNKLNNKGIKEGIISDKKDEFDKTVAFNNSVLSILHYQKNFTQFKDIKFEEILERSYTYYIKLLS